MPYVLLIRHVDLTVWTGIKASTVGILFSMIVMFFEVAQLLIYFLRAPQAGIPVIQTTGGPASWVSAADIAGLMALLLTMFVEVAVLAFSLWLLYRTTVPTVEFPHAGDRQSLVSIVAEQAMCISFVAIFAF